VVVLQVVVVLRLAAVEVLVMIRRVVVVVTVVMPPTCLAMMLDLASFNVSMILLACLILHRAFGGGDACGVFGCLNYFREFLLTGDYMGALLPIIILFV
jgi:hypothetical protein